MTWLAALLIEPFTPLATVLAIIGLASFMMSLIAFLFLVAKLGYGLGSFVDSQNRTAEAMIKVASSFQIFCEQQSTLNDRFENALELFGERISKVEIERRDANA